MVMSIYVMIFPLLLVPNYEKTVYSDLVVLFASVGTMISANRDNFIAG